MRTFIVQAAPLIMHIRSKATRITNMKLPKKKTSSHLQPTIRLLLFAHPSHMQCTRCIYIGLQKVSQRMSVSSEIKMWR